MTSPPLRPPLGVTPPALSPPTSTQVANAQTGAALAVERSKPPPGLCSLTWHGERLTFRTNPNAIEWTYSLNTKVENTYGGRVIQILSCKIDDLTVTVDCGWGGWPEAMRICNFMSRLMNVQRQGAGSLPATFEYTTRNWKMNVFAASVPFQDEVTATTRELELRFKVQEDVSGYMSQASIGAELSGLQEGIGGGHDQYNTGSGKGWGAEQPSVSVASTATGVTNLLQVLGSVAGFLNLGGIPSDLLGGSTSFMGLIPQPLAILENAEGLLGSFGQGGGLGSLLGGI